MESEIFSLASRDALAITVFEEHCLPIMVGWWMNNGIEFKDDSKTTIRAQQLIEQERSKPDSHLKTTGLDTKPNIESSDLPIYVVRDDESVPSAMELTRFTDRIERVRPHLVHIFARNTEPSLKNSCLVTIGEALTVPRLESGQEAPSLITLTDFDDKSKYGHRHVMSSLVDAVDGGTWKSNDNKLGRVDTYLAW